MDVADLTTANKIDTTNLANKMATFNKQIDKTLEKLRDFDTNNSIDGDRTNNLIEELSGLNSYVKKLSPNRARISSTSGKIDKARFVHKTSEELIKWQKYMESISDSIEGQPGLNKNTMKQWSKQDGSTLLLKLLVMVVSKEVLTNF